MKYVFVDFEMNPIANYNKLERKVCKSEIIQIGAVMLDEEHNEISHFNQYVLPQFNKEITSKCTKLTGITIKELKDARVFNDSLLEFLIWCITFSEGDYKIYAWSENDLLQLRQEMLLKQTVKMPELNFMIDNWYDFQREYCDLLGIYRPISLETAIGSIGENFMGRIHDALWDARNTATIFSLTRNKREFNEVMAPILKSFSVDREAICTLGDLFNFSDLAYVTA